MKCLQDRKKSDRQTIFRQIRWFSLAGAIAFLSDAIILSAGLAIGLGPIVARIPSFVVAVLITWHMNRTVTFRTPDTRSLKEFSSYLSSMSVGLAINFSVYGLIVNQAEFALLFPALALIPAATAAIFFNFIASRFILFR